MSKEIITMKLAIRIFAALVVLAGAGAAAVTVPSSSAHVMPSSQAVSAALPGPVCTPGMPTCAPQPCCTCGCSAMASLYL